jgi:rod shape-determining protein MreC
MGRASRESFFERHHFVTYLVLAGTGLGLATLGVRRPERLDPVKRAGLAIVSPFARVGSAATGGVTGAWDGVQLTWTAREDLLAAEQRVQELQLQVADRDELAAENDRFRSLLDLAQRVPFRTVPARIVYQERGPDAVLVVDRGASSGVREDQAVISPDGVVGKVLTVGPSSARVQCVIDGDAGIAVLVGADRRQANAIVTSGGAGRCRLRHLELLPDLEPGDRVVTSGLDLIYPRGLLVGTIESVHSVPGVQQEIVVIPAVDFTRLEEVLIVAGDGSPIPTGREGRADATVSRPLRPGTRT